jgi:hypothetical protein
MCDWPVAAELCKIVPDNIVSATAADPARQERLFRDIDSKSQSFWLDRADAAVDALMNSEDSLRMLVFRELFLTGTKTVVLTDAGFVIRDAEQVPAPIAGDFQGISFEQGWSKETETSVLLDFISEHGLGAALTEYAASRAEAEQLGVEDEEDEEDESVVPWEPDGGVD